jgi:hypothetical protein
MQDMEQTIRERAYHLWVEGGRHEGDADAYWLAAQREIVSTSLSTIARVTSRPLRPKAKKDTSSSKKRRHAA